MNAIRRSIYYSPKQVYNSTQKDTMPPAHKKIMADNHPPAHHYVPVHCIPRVLVLTGADGEACAYACPAELIQTGRWFVNRFADDEDRPVFYEARADGAVWMAVRALTEEPDAQVDVADHDRFRVGVSARFGVRKKRRDRGDTGERTQTPCVGLALYHGKSVVVSEWHPSPGLRSGWGLVVLGG